MTKGAPNGKNNSLDTLIHRLLDPASELLRCCPFTTLVNDDQAIARADFAQQFFRLYQLSLGNGIPIRCRLKPDLLNR